MKQLTFKRTNVSNEGIFPNCKFFADLEEVIKKISLLREFYSEDLGSNKNRNITFSTN